MNDLIGWTGDPILVAVYARLARSEEREVAKHFGEEGTDYAVRTPAFLPRPGSRRTVTPPAGPSRRRP